MMRRDQFIAGMAATVGAAFSFPRPAIAQGTGKVTRIIVPFSAGSGTDVVARILGRELGPRLGQTFVVENQTGAGGNIATTTVARADPDAHTMILTTTAHSIAPNIYRTLPFDVLNDFAAVALVCSGPLVLVANSSFPAKSTAELIAMAKAAPGKINYASSGTGTTPHLAMELLKVRTGIDLVHVPYRGGNPAIIDVIANVVPLYFAGPATAMPMVDSGQVRALGQSSLERPSFLPTIPTIVEQGVPGYEVALWYGLLAPAKTPRPVVDRLNAEIADILKRPDIVQQLQKLGFDPKPTTPEGFDKMIRDEITVWAEVAKTAKVYLD